MSLTISEILGFIMDGDCKDALFEILWGTTLSLLTILYSKEVDGPKRTEIDFRVSYEFIIGISIIVMT